MDQCPNCNSMLNGDEKAAGRCFSCGAAFESDLSKNTTFNSDYSGNKIGKMLKILGIAIFVIGTIGSFILSLHEVYGKYEFSFVGFIIPEMAIIIGGAMFLGLSEIIQLLQDIKNKLK